MTRTVGSSPHMRGTQLCWFAHAPMAGIIPAYAGNTVPLRSIHSAYWDHPRICGEHKMNPTTFSGSTGSSPHMRGTPKRAKRSAVSNGIIPAYAGNTPLTVDTQRAYWDHPRICGEHCCGMAWFIATTGSSPHMRGTRGLIHTVDQTHGIIPAYAGNTPGHSD